MFYELNQLVRFIIILSLIKSSSSNSTSNQDLVFGSASCVKENPISCPYLTKDQVITQPQICCENLVKTFRCSWFTGYSFLTRYLQILRSWNCTKQFEFECNHKTFAFNEFTKNVYLLFCDKPALEQKCLSTLQEYLVRNNSHFFNQLDTDKLKKEVPANPCVQIAVYETNRFQFVEIIDTFLVGIPLVWCGYDASTVHENGLSIWTCVDQNYRVTTAIFAAIHIILAIFTIYVSTMVLIIHFYKQSLNNSQSIFKVSIAVSDVIIGVFVLPSIANNLLNGQKRPERFDNITIATKEAFIATPDLIESRGLTIFFGMCFVVAFIVSTFNLLFAAFDRFFIIFRPLAYRRHNSKKFAFRSVILIWIVAIAVSLLPVILNPYLSYGFIFDVVSVVGGEILYVTIFYGVLAFPVPIMWVTILATYVKCHQNFKKSLKITTTGSRKKDFESRLVRTLLLMVTSFTVGFLPMLIVLVIGFTIPKLEYKNPTDFNINQASELLSAEFFAYICIILNTVSNFFIYSWRNPEFKKAKLEVTSKLINKIHFRSLITRMMTSVTRSNVPAKPEKVVKFVASTRPTTRPTTRRRTI